MRSAYVCNVAGNGSPPEPRTLEPPDMTFGDPAQVHNQSGPIFLNPVPPPPAVVVADPLVLNQSPPVEGVRTLEPIDVDWSKG